MYYAGYNLDDTDIAVFDSPEKRDTWVHDDLDGLGLFHRIVLAEAEVADMLFPFNADCVTKEPDLFDDSFFWLVKPIDVV